MTRPSYAPNLAMCQPKAPAAAARERTKRATYTPHALYRPAVPRLYGHITPRIQHTSPHSLCLVPHEPTHS